MTENVAKRDKTRRSKRMNDKQLEQILQEEPDEAKVWQAVTEYRKAYMQGRENKQRICDLLFATLKETRQHMDLQSLYYEKLESGDEMVTVHWSAGGTVVVIVTADSGIAMIHDILKAIK